jgi:signal transduction histidine kinase/ActR/RegA family two-component response regulator
MDKNFRILSQEIRFERDVVQSRQRARQIAALLGFDSQDQTRIVTAVSEVARNSYQYAGGGKVEFSLMTSEELNYDRYLNIEISDQGPGILKLKEVIEGKFSSKTGLGLGLIGAKRLMDKMRIESAPGHGTRVVLQKKIYGYRDLTVPEIVSQISTALAQQSLQDPIEEIQQQNQDLLKALAELQTYQSRLTEANQTLVETNRELEETNRGVVALYKEIDEKAEALKRANEIKTRFISHMSHEFRTPLISILGISRVLQDRLDGDLSPEQQKQVGFIHKAAHETLEMVNDLLDLAKVESGKTSIQFRKFEICDLFVALKGMMKPLLTNPKVQFIIEDASKLPPLCSDESKVAQILRNLISNAIKFTAEGEVRLSAKTGPNDTILFEVQDTGIGILPENQSKIFQEYFQIDSPAQRSVKGTGLGLTVVKNFTELLGGHIDIQSELNQGTKFTITLPIHVQPQTVLKTPVLSGTQRTFQEKTAKVLIIDDDEVSRYLLRNILENTHYSTIEATSGIEGIRTALKERPDLITLDLVMPELDGFEVLRRLKEHPSLKEIPVIIRTSKILEDEEVAQLRRDAAEILSKDVSSNEVVVSIMNTVLSQCYSGRKVTTGTELKSA